jgi:hypothetical protein
MNYWALPETIINAEKDALDCSNALFMLNLIKKWEKGETRQWKRINALYYPFV